MLPRLHLFIVFCLSPGLAQAEVAGDAVDNVDTPVNAADRLEQEQEETRRQVFSEGEDPQAQTTIERQVEAEEQIQQEYEKKGAPVAEEQLDKVREAVQAEEDEPRPEREKEVQKVVFEPALEGKIYGSIRLHYRSTDQGSIFGDAGSRLGAEGGWRTRPDAWLYARIEAGFNVLDELDQLLSPGGSSGEGEQGDSVFPRLYTIGIETPALVASIGKNWSTYYRVANFTDRFDSAGSDALGTFNANTDGGATGTGRADGVFQSRAYMDFLPETWNVEPFNLNVQLQSGQPIPRVEGVKYQNAIGLSTVLELSDDFTFGIAYNRAQIEDLDNAAVQAAGIKGDAKALLFGARWFDEQWYLGFTIARLENHETTDKGTYFLGWGSELYARSRLIKNYWFVTGYNWLSPDEDQTQAGQFELLYGVVGLRYSIDDFKRLAYAEWRLDSTISEDGETLGNIFTIGLRWGF